MESSTAEFLIAVSAFAQAPTSPLANIYHILHDVTAPGLHLLVFQARLQRPEENKLYNED